MSVAEVTLENAWAVTQAEFTCDHVQQQLTVRVACNGGRHYRNQCLRCGQNTGSVLASSLSESRKRSVPEFDDALEESWRKRRSDRFDAIRQGIIERDRRDWDRWYSAYLLSPEWRDRRESVLNRDRYICQGCRIAKATQVHHLTYAHVGAELLFELVAICDECHAAAHVRRESEAKATS